MATITTITDDGIYFVLGDFFGPGSSRGNGTFRNGNGDTLVFSGQGSTYMRATFLEGDTGRSVANVTGVSIDREELADPGTDELAAALGNVRFLGGAGDDVIGLSSGFDTVFAGEGDDTLLGGGSYGDELFGQVGDDTFRAIYGDLLFDGGAGSDTADLTEVYSQTGLTVDLRLTSSQIVNDASNIPAYSLALRLRSIENVDGGAGNDRITGNAAANTLRGRNGDDRLDGGRGNDVLDGGSGFDYADYSAFGSSTVRLSSTAAQNVGAAGSDRLLSIEGVLGGNGADLFVGNAVGNTLDGGGGNDTLNGGSGNDSVLGGSGRDMLVGGLGNDTLGGGANEDVIDGGAGTDIMAGGAAADRFVFRSSDEANGDLVVDFIGSQGDRLDLRLIDANTGAGGDQAFAFIGASGFTGVAGQLRYQTTSPNPGTPVFVQGDTNGDGQAEFQITLLPGFPYPVLADFLL